MERSTLALVLASTVIASGVAGCIQDLERRHLETSWTPQVQLTEAPVREAHGAPSMLVASGPVTVPADARITVTGFEANTSRQNTTIPFEAMRVHSSEGTQRAGEAEGSLSLGAGQNLTVTFAPGDDAPRRANPSHGWNTSVEVLWRYEDGGAFDAGRLETQRNTTPSRVDGLGVGVVNRSHGQVHGLVFEAIDPPPLGDQVGLVATQVGGGTAETVERLEANVTTSDGTARVTLPSPLEVPQGSGYLVFRLDDPGGVATTGLVGGQEPIPSTTVLITLAAIAGAALVTARTFRRRS